MLHNPKRGIQMTDDQETQLVDAVDTAVNEAAGTQTRFRPVVDAAEWPTAASDHVSPVSARAATGLMTLQDFHQSFGKLPFEAQRRITDALKEYAVGAQAWLDIMNAWHRAHDVTRRR